jgi:hypothetical protein
LDRLAADMQGRLDKVMQKVYNPQAQDIVKGLRKEAGLQENVITKKQEISMSRTLVMDNSQNMDPNRGIDMSQQSVWAEELRRADERALKFKQDLAESERRR